MLPNNTSQAPKGCPPGSPPARAVAEELAKHRLNVHFPYDDDSLFMKVTSERGGRCEMTLDEDDGIACDYHSADVKHAKPGEIAASVARMTGADYTDPGRYARLHKGVTLAGAVGRDMKARGQSVTLHVTKDSETYTALAEIVITNPEQPGRGEVHVADDGWLYWECYTGDLPGGTAELADTIAAALLQPATPRNRLRDCLRHLSTAFYVQTRAARRQRQQRTGHPA